MNEGKEVVLLRAICGMDQPWPLHNVIRQLCEAVDHLLSSHNYCDGHELYKEVRNRGLMYLERLETLGDMGDMAPEAKSSPVLYFERELAKHDNQIGGLIARTDKHKKRLGDLEKRVYENIKRIEALEGRMDQVVILI